MCCVFPIINNSVSLYINAIKNIGTYFCIINQKRQVTVKLSFSVEKPGTGWKMVDILYHFKFFF